MSEQQYRWMLSAIAAWRQQDADGDDGFVSPEIDLVTAVAGHFAKYDQRSANELAAALFIFLLVFAWNSAKIYAKSGGFRPDLCKIGAASIFWLLGCIPHEMWLAGAAPLFDPSAKTITSPQWIPNGYQ